VLNQTLLETPLKNDHIGRGARMVSFAGWTMPLHYAGGILAEHHHTRSGASVFDTSHMSQFRITGSGSASGLDRLMARSTESQPPGTCRYNFLMNAAGGIRDDLVVYRMAEQEYLIVGNAGTHRSDLAWIQDSLPDAVKVRDESMETGKIDLQGPESAEVLNLAGLKPATLPAYFRWRRLTLFGENVLISRTGYTGELGFEVYVPWVRTPEIWERLLENPGVQPAGLGARDTLRLEAGLPLYGQDMDEDTTPLEAGFETLVDMDRSFLGREALVVQARKRFVGIRLEGRRAGRHGMAVFSEDGERIGTVTSGCFAPSLGYAVATAYIVKHSASSEGTPVLLNSRENGLPGHISKLPFYESGTARIKLL